MSKFSRAVWRAEENGLQVACEEAEVFGDETAQSETYKRLAEHHDDATLAEKISNIPTILKIITGH